MAEDEIVPEFGGDNALDEKRASEVSQPSQAPSDSSSEENQSQARARDPKEDVILDACRRRDIDELQTLAESRGGFLTDELRQEAWPVLLGMPIVPETLEEKPDLNVEDFSWKSLPGHKDEEQVQLDVERAFVYYPDYKTDSERTSSKASLSNLILSVLRRYPYIHYFQGYHDIAQVFLLVLPPRLRSPAVARLSLLRIRDFMHPDFTAALAQLRLIPSILRAADPTLWAHLSQTEPFFALSGTLTMYAHDIQSQNEITRLFDVLLAREPVFSVYMFAQIVLNRRDELFETDATERDMLQAILGRLPQPLHIDALVASTAALFDRFPPETLGRAWTRDISEFSVLKTARSTRACAGQSEGVAEYFFAQHVAEIQGAKRREERRERVKKVLWRYRRPAGAVGAAVLAGLLAYWLRRTSLPIGLVGPAHTAGRLLSAAWEKFRRALVDL